MNTKKQFICHKVFRILFLFFVILIFANCKTTKKITNTPAAKSSTAQPVATNIETILNDKATIGIDFFAIGNDSLWSLEIDFDKSMHFKILNGLEIITPAAKGVKAADADVTRYHAQTEQGILTVQLFKGQPCTNAILGKAGYKVTIATKNNIDNDYQDFTGCGIFIGNR